MRNEPNGDKVLHIQKIENFQTSKEMFRSDAHATDRHCRGSESDGFPESYFPSTSRVNESRSRPDPN